MILRLLKSLYGLRQAPKTFFDKLKAGLLERGFIQSQLDPCQFMKRDMIWLIYVDDTIIAGPDSAAIDREIHNLGVSNDEQHHQFELRDEGEVGDFLGICIEKLGRLEVGEVLNIWYVHGRQHLHIICLMCVMEFERGRGSSGGRA
jgi:hypothetical protein